MLPIPLIIIFGVCILIWQVVLTVLFIRTFNQNKRLIKNLSADNLEKVINGISGLNKRIDILEREELKHIQKVGFVRFNPFNETGGDNSFTLCLLDGNLDGVILTGLHTREKTRMYMKRLLKAKSEHELSNEEKQAIQLATK